MARRLELHIAESPNFAMRAPVTLNIACFGVKDDPDGQLSREIVMDLHERGEAAPSLTILDGVPAIRAAIINHRTREEDIDAFMQMLEGAVRRARREPHEAEPMKPPPSGPGRSPLAQD